MEGYIQPTGSEPERFMRIVNSQIVLGILPDLQKSITSVIFDKSKLFFAVTPVDALGNLVSPENMPTTVVKISDITVKAIYKNEYSGEHRFEIKFKTTWEGYIEFMTMDGKKIVY